MRFSASKGRTRANNFRLPYAELTSSRPLRPHQASTKSGNMPAAKCRRFARHQPFEFASDLRAVSLKMLCKMRRSETLAPEEEIDDTEDQ